MFRLFFVQQMVVIDPGTRPDFSCNLHLAWNPNGVSLAMYTLGSSLTSQDGANELGDDAQNKRGLGFYDILCVARVFKTADKNPNEIVTKTD